MAKKTVTSVAQSVFEKAVDTFVVSEELAAFLKAKQSNVNLAEGIRAAYTRAGQKFYSARIDGEINVALGSNGTKGASVRTKELLALSSSAWDDKEREERLVGLILSLLCPTEIQFLAGQIVYEYGKSAFQKLLANLGYEREWAELAYSVGKIYHNATEHIPSENKTKKRKSTPVDTEKIERARAKLRDSLSTVRQRTRRYANMEEYRKAHSKESEEENKDNS